MRRVTSTGALRTVATRAADARRGARPRQPREQQPQRQQPPALVAHGACRVDGVDQLAVLCGVDHGRRRRQKRPAAVGGAAGASRANDSYS